jgi:hypothetical protein|tara:strand:- start:227 stop:517 length:291 start_codon:yes stop_codon:yes gene_type:complete
MTNGSKKKRRESNRSQNKGDLFPQSNQYFNKTMNENYDEEYKFQREWKVKLYLYSNEDPELWIKEVIEKHLKEERGEVKEVYTDTTGDGKHIGEGF